MKNPQGTKFFQKYNIEQTNKQTKKAMKKGHCSVAL